MALKSPLKLNKVRALTVATKRFSSPKKQYSILDDSETQVFDDEKIRTNQLKAYGLFAELKEHILDFDSIYGK